MEPWYSNGITVQSATVFEIYCGTKIHILGTKWYQGTSKNTMYTTMVVRYI